MSAGPDRPFPFPWVAAILSAAAGAVIVLATVLVILAYRPLMAARDTEPQLDAGSKPQSPDGRLKLGETYRLDLPAKIPSIVGASYPELDLVTVYSIQDHKEALEELVRNGRAIRVATGTKVKLLGLQRCYPSDDVEYLGAKVWLLDGPEQGRTAYVWAERLR